MELDRHQYGVLRTYLKWRRDPPTFGSLLLANLKPLAVVALYCAAAAFAFVLLGIPEWGLIGLGIWIGNFVAECARIRSIPVVWSVLTRVLDWTRVEQALAELRSR